MADETPTRQETVAANLAAVENKYGPEAFNQIFKVLLKDINISLAILCDGTEGAS